MIQVYRKLYSTETMTYEGTSCIEAMEHYRRWADFYFGAKLVRNGVVLRECGGRRTHVV